MNATPNGTDMVLEALNDIRSILEVEVERRVVDAAKGIGGQSQVHAQTTEGKSHRLRVEVRSHVGVGFECWVETLPLLRGSGNRCQRKSKVAKLQIKRTPSSSTPRNPTTPSEYRTIGCLVILLSHRSRSPLLASTKSSENRPAYCFSGKGGTASEGNLRARYDWRARKCENRRSTVMMALAVESEGFGEGKVEVIRS